MHNGNHHSHNPTSYFQKKRKNRRRKKEFEAIDCLLIKARFFFFVSFCRNQPGASLVSASCASHTKKRSDFYCNSTGNVKLSHFSSAFFFVGFLMIIDWIEGERKRAVT